MEDNYGKIINDYLEKLYRKKDAAAHLAEFLPGEQSGETVTFRAFGDECRISPEGIFLGDEKQEGPQGIVIVLYAVHARRMPCVLEPLKSFKDFPGSMPYVGAFTSHTQNPLIPYAEQLEGRIDRITESLGGKKTQDSVGGDFSFLVYPVPKIALCYVIYEADEDFPASVTCLFSGNADDFLPLDGLADLGEYTTKKIIDLLA